LHFASNGTSQLELQVSGKADPFLGTGPDALPARAWSFELRVFGPLAEGLARQLEEGSLVRVDAEFVAYADAGGNRCVGLRVVEAVQLDLEGLAVQGRMLERASHPQGGTLLSGAVNEVRLSGRLGRAVQVRGEGDSSFAWVSLATLQSGKTVWLDLGAEGRVARDLASLEQGDALDLEGHLGYRARKPAAGEGSEAIPRQGAQGGAPAAEGGNSQRYTLQVKLGQVWPHSRRLTHSEAS